MMCDIFHLMGFVRYQDKGYDEATAFLKCELRTVLMDLVSSVNKYEF